MPIDNIVRHALCCGTMTPNDLLTIWPTQAEIARVLGVKPPSVAEWFENGAIPEGRQYQAQIASGGKLQADKPAMRSVEKAA